VHTGPFKQSELIVFREFGWSPDQISAGSQVASVHSPMHHSSRLRLRYKGRTIEVLVLRDGFEFEGELYSSLSAIAKHVTGSHWNGFRFFNLPSKGAC